LQSVGYLDSLPCAASDRHAGCACNLLSLLPSLKLQHLGRRQTSTPICRIAPWPCTGQGNIQGCNAAASAVGQVLALRLDEILHVSVGGGCSFGVQAATAVPVLVKSLGSDGEAGYHAACALTTADTICKTASLEVGWDEAGVQRRGSGALAARLPALCIALRK
jgi:hypothetical protein